jgi:membrane protease subunit HflK
MYIDMMQQILTSSSKVLVDQKSGNGSLLYLPLDKLIQSTAPGAEAAAAKAMEQPVAPAAAADTGAGHMRESLRGRDREAR